MRGVCNNFIISYTQNTSIQLHQKHFGFKITYLSLQTQVSGVYTKSMEALLNSLLLYFVLLLTIVTSPFIILKVIKKFKFDKEVKENLAHDTWVRLLIRMPSKNEGKEEEMEVLIRSLHHILSSNTSINFEIVSINQFLRFYVVIPANLKSVVESQLFAQYPEAEIEESQEYLSEFGQDSAQAELRFRKLSVHPFSTYRESDENLLKQVWAMLSNTDGPDRVYIQLSLRRIGSRFWDRGLRYMHFLFFGPKYDSDNKPTPSYLKLTDDLYEGVLRIIHVSQDKKSANEKLKALCALFKSTKGANELKVKKSLFLKYIDEAFRARVFDSGDLWTPREIATVYHFLPYKGTAASNVANTTSKRSPAPEYLPREGEVDPKEVSFFGVTNYRNEEKVFGIKRADRRQHMYVVGKTGVGKSKLMELLCVSDILNGDGCCFLDPHGDSVDELLKYVPKSRMEDVIYVNPGDRDFPVGFNPLEPLQEQETKHRLSSFFVAIFKKLFEATWNPRMEHLIRYVTLALLDTPDSNVLGIERMLSDTKFRQRVIMQIQDPVVKSFWTNEFGSWNERYANDAVVPILNKVGQFISNPVIRNMVGQTRNALDFEKFMNEGKIVLINLSKGKLGEDNTSLLGSMFITKIQQAALARSKMREEERRDFYFYVDEFQNFANEAFSSILSEARKYHLNLTIAHQYIAQLPQDVKATAFGNVGSLVSFAVGGDDANYLTRELLAVFAPEDLINLNKREMYVKLLVDGKVTPPFSAKTINLQKPERDYSNQILDFSRMKYGRNRTEVEREIEKWTNATQSVATSASDFPEPII